VETAERTEAVNTEVLAEGIRVSNPFQLLQAAIDRGLDPDKLGKLMDLSERWTQNQAEKAYAEAMNACQSEMPVVIKDADNRQTNSKYARFETIDITAKPIYTRHGFSIDYGNEEPKQAECFRIFIEVTHKEGHSKRRWIELPADTMGLKGTPNKTLVHGVASSTSYAKRILLCMAFNITIAGEDFDGNSVHLTITPDQTKDINDLLEECRQLGKPVDFQRFLAWLGVEDLGQLQQKDFPKAIRELNRKRKAVVK
jgi:hypothetical protein